VGFATLRLPATSAVACDDFGWLAPSPAELPLEPPAKLEWMISRPRDRLPSRSCRRCSPADAPRIARALRIVCAAAEHAEAMAAAAMDLAEWAGGPPAAHGNHPRKICTCCIPCANAAQAPRGTPAARTAITGVSWESPASRPRAPH
jgi:hypothetical protein